MVCLNIVNKKWCVREGVDANVLRPWLLKIPQLSNIHETYVLVRANKAANNVIIVRTKSTLMYCLIQFRLIKS